MTKRCSTPTQNKFSGRLSLALCAMGQKKSDPLVEQKPTGDIRWSLVCPVLSLDRGRALRFLLFGLQSP